MQNDLNNALQRIARKEPSRELFARILAQVKVEERRGVIYARIGVLGTAALLSLVALVPALRELYAEFTQSGFVQFLSLLISDAGIVAVYWQDFLISLAEALPVFGVAGVAASIFVLMLSTRYLARDIRALSRRSSFAL